MTNYIVIGTKPWNYQVFKEVLDLNMKVIKLHKKFQFKEEGIFKTHIYKNEQYQDVICLALFREDWLEHKNNLFGTVFRA